MRAVVQRVLSASVTGSTLFFLIVVDALVDIPRFSEQRNRVRNLTRVDGACWHRRW